MISCIRNTRGYARDQRGRRDIEGTQESPPDNAWMTVHRLVRRPQTPLEAATRLEVGGPLPKKPNLQQFFE